MKSYIIFPETAWTKFDLGFAGIKDLHDEMKKKNVKFRLTPEFMAMVFEIENLDEETMKLIRKKLPDDYEIPALLDGRWSIISKDRVIPCAVGDEKLKKLQRDAQVQFSKIGIEKKIQEISPLSLAEINKLCNEFGDSEGIPMPLKEFDIERLQKLINVNKKFEHKLVGILVDIKSIWFALDYDLTQLARNTGKDVKARFKRYAYINNAIVRIRALWEKLIGLAILLERPDDFNKILSKGKVRSAFIKNFKGSHNAVVRDIWDYSHSLELFEQRFRTPELHKIGRTMRWAAQEELDEEINRFLGYRNSLNRLLRNIAKRFEEGQK